MWPLTRRKGRRTTLPASGLPASGCHARRRRQGRCGHTRGDLRQNPCQLRSVSLHHWPGADQPPVTHLNQIPTRQPLSRRTETSPRKAPQPSPDLMGSPPAHRHFRQAPRRHTLGSPGPQKFFGSRHPGHRPQRLAVIGRLESQSSHWARYSHSFTSIS